ncbi:MAG: sulfotransferase [Pseudomonadota bacterium]
MTDNLRKGLALYERGAFAEAVVAFDACGAGDARALCLKGSALAQLKKNKEADVAFASALALAPADPLMRTSYAAFLQATGRTNEAESQATQVIDSIRANNDQEISLSVGEAFMRSGLWRAAAEAYGAAAEQSPLDEQSACRAAIATFRAGDTQRALHMLEILDASGVASSRTYKTGAMLVAELGDWNRLEVIARAWLEDFPDDNDARSRLSHALFEQGRLPEAADAYEPIALEKADDAGVQTTRGRLAIAARRLDIAKVAFERALSMSPKNAEALTGLARVSAFHGEIEAAQKLIRDALAADPNYLPAYSELAAITEGNMTDGEMDQLARFAAQGEKLPIAFRTTVHFARGDGFHFRGDYEAAFQAYEAANIGVLRGLKAPYDHDAEKRRFTEICERFGALTPLPATDKAPIFVLGMPRSGTTLMEGILAAHPDVQAGGEVVEMLAGLDQIAATSHVGKNEIQEALASIQARYLAEISAETDDQRRVVDKQPLNFKAIGLIQTVFPGAPVIHMMRSPIEVCFSIYRRNFSNHWAFASDLTDLAKFYALYVRYMEHWARAFPDQVKTIRYRDVIGNLGEAARGAVNHCGLDWNSACLSPEKTKRSAVTFSRVQVRKPVSQQYSGQNEPYRANLEPLIKALRDEGVDPDSGERI